MICDSFGWSAIKPKDVGIQPKAGVTGSGGFECKIA